jgi:GMP reductase
MYMKIIEELKYNYSDVLIVPKRSKLKSRSEVDLNVNYTFKHSKKKYTGTPIMAANMDGVGTFNMESELDKYNMFTCLIKHYSEEELIRHFRSPKPNSAISIGTNNNDLIKLTRVFKASIPQYICLDVANGYTDSFIDTIRILRTQFPTTTLIAGNVVTGDMTMELIKNGVDIVKVGIGPGSVCTTRLQTGVGYPQLSAVLECAHAAHVLGGHIIADGGCTSPGDVAKAFGAGADFVMLGGMLAGHDEGCRKPIDGKVMFYGMSSDTAMNKHNGGVADYRSSEGRTVTIPYRGPVSNTVRDLLGGLRSACTYVGAANLSQFADKVEFIRCTDTHNRVFTT